MKLDQLRKIIREEVKSAVKEELQDVITEAVKIASKPDQTLYEGNIGKPYMDVAAPIKKVNTTFTSADPIMEMLNQTKASMSNEEYRNISTNTSDMVQKPNFASMMASNMGMTEQKGPTPGLDISQFDFVKKAGQVYKKSVEKDKQKYGVV